MKEYPSLFVFIVIISCNAQNNLPMEPKIDNQFEKFDSIFCEELSKKNTNNIMLSDGSHVEILKLKESRYFNTPNDSYFTIVKLYYENLNIKKKGLGFNVGPFAFKKGPWYEFDEKGNLVNEINYDKPFKYTFEDIVRFCEERNIKIIKGFIPQSGWYNKISRSIENGHPVWEIEHLKKSDLVEIIKLDGITGKILSTSTYKYINN